MCGIAGYLTEENSRLNRAVLERMCDSLAHRGPDDCGYYFNGHAALGHRRLNVIDVAAGSQPLGNEDGAIQVVFNGEIYNYAALRSELLKMGHCFRTRSDTEVLVHLYEEVGERLPEFLNGMFAFAIWDTRRQELFMARDRLGKKPLYYSFAVSGMRFCFASELKALAVLPGFTFQVNYRSVADFLSLSYVPDPATIHANVARLEPGHSLTVTRSGSRLRRYWKPEFSADSKESPERVMERLGSLARDAVKIRLVSEVPLGAFLSGGLDSSAVVALMADESQTRTKTFSIGFTNQAFDERRFAHLVVERYRTEHREEIISPSINEMLETVVNHFDEPFGDSSAIPMLYLARMTRQYVTVALGGDGADELFGGYRRYCFGILEERLRRALPDWFRYSVIKLGARYYPKFDYLPQVFRAKTLLTNLSQQIADAYFTSISVFRDHGLAAVLSPEARRALGAYLPRDSFRERFHRVRELLPLEQMQAVDLETYLPGDILVKADRATMAYSLESRSPWLDYRIAELACRLPSFLKVRGWTGKYIFRRAMAPLLPGPVLTRRKMGFSVPLAEWLRGSLVKTFESMVLAPEMEEYLSLNEVRRIWVEHQSGYHNHDKKLWTLLMLACWHARWRNGSYSFDAEEAASVPA